MKGIVHDASGSGQTLFVEPLVVVELGNAWREAQVAERGGGRADPRRAVGARRRQRDAAARDARGARPVRLLGREGAAGRRDGRRSGPRPPTAPEVVLLSARHPGLTGRVVPIDIRLGDGYTALVVTGPNTGGKTVTLRTLGPARAHAPGGAARPGRGRQPRCRCSATSSPTSATSSRSPSRCRRSRATCARSSGSSSAAGPGTLVLLDELGAGTDPTEGSALAQALLDHFIRAGALVAATTHYAELKAYAHTTPARTNASVEFDLETLVADVPADDRAARAASQAFAIAERLGLPEAIVADARSGSPRTSGRSRRRSRRSASRRARPREAARSRPRGRAAGGRGAARPPTRSAGRPAGSATRPSAPPGRGGAARGATCATTSRAARRALERETVTAPAIDAALARAEQTLGRLPEPADAAPRAGRRRARATWQLGDRARSRTRRLGGPDRGARAGRHAGDPRGRRHAGHRRRRGPGGAVGGSAATAAGDGVAAPAAAGTRRVARVGPAGTASATCSSIAPAASRRRWTCAAPASTRRWRPWTATSTTRRWPVSSKVADHPRPRHGRAARRRADAGRRAPAGQERPPGRAGRGRRRRDDRRRL